MAHQLVSEGDLKNFCIYCKTEVQPDSWSSAWHLEKHYKGITCKCCGKPLHLTVNFEGSGHDSWNGRKFAMHGQKKTIEDKIVVIERTKIVEKTK